MPGSLLLYPVSTDAKALGKLVETTLIWSGVLCLYSESLCVTQSGLELTIPLPQFTVCWNPRCVVPCLALISIFKNGICFALNLIYLVKFTHITDSKHITWRSDFQRSCSVYSLNYSTISQDIGVSTHGIRL